MIVVVVVVAAVAVAAAVCRFILYRFSLSLLLLLQFQQCVVQGNGNFFFRCSFQRHLPLETISGNGAITHQAMNDATLPMRRNKRNDTQSFLLFDDAISIWDKKYFFFFLFPLKIQKGKRCRKAIVVNVLMITGIRTALSFSVFFFLSFYFAAESFGRWSWAIKDCHHTSAMRQLKWKKERNTRKKTKARIKIIEGEEEEKEKS